MEQYLNLVWKNYTDSLSHNSNENSLDEQDDASDLFADNNLHYNIPFWVGIIVIALLLLSAIVATIRYCIYTLCSSSTESEKVALMSPRSPCLSSSTANTIQRQRHSMVKAIPHHLSDEKQTPSSSSEQSRDHYSDISITPIFRQPSQSHFTSRRHQQTEIDTNDANDHSVTSQIPIDFRRKIHGIYVLPVSPALSSSSSSTATTSTDEVIKTSLNTMSIRSRKHLSSSVAVHNESTCHGIRNVCFTDSPQLKDRTLRTNTDTLRRIQAPSQRPPSPPTILQVPCNDKSSFQQRLSAVDLDSNTVALRFSSGEKNQVTKPMPPPVPCRSQKPPVLPIDFEELTKQSDQPIDNEFMVESFLQDDYSEHAWPKPPESMSTSVISGPSSISYDHLIPIVVMDSNSSTNIFHLQQHNANSMLTESET